MLSGVSMEESVFLLIQVVSSIQFLVAVGLRSPFPYCQLRVVPSFWRPTACLCPWPLYPNFKTSSGRLSPSHDLTLSCLSFPYLLFCLPLLLLRAHAISLSPLKIIWNNLPKLRINLNSICKVSFAMQTQVPDVDNLGRGGVILPTTWWHQYI